MKESYEAAPMKRSRAIEKLRQCREFHPVKSS
jgi:hypothetical protein